MKKNQTSKRNGYEDFLMPFTTMRISQRSNGAYSHKGTMANDVAGTGKRDAYYAPCTCKCIWVNKAYGQALWQSTNKVRFANGRVDYASFMTGHDDSFDAYVGVLVKQGHQLGNMGVKSPLKNVTGIHCHFQVAQSKYTIKDWKYNKYGVPCFPKEYDIYDCCFIDNTTLKNYTNLKWRKIKDVPIATYKNVCATAGLWLREKKGTSSKKIKLLLYGTKVELLEANSGSANGYQWSKIKVSGKTGYVASKYLK